MSVFVHSACRASLAARRSSVIQATTRLRTYAASTRSSPKKSPLTTKAAASTTAKDVDSSKGTENVPNTGDIFEPDAETLSEAVASASTASFTPPHSPFVGELPPGNDALSTDWSRSYHGLSTQSFSREIADVLLTPIDEMDIEVKPGKHDTSILIDLEVESFII